MYPYTNEEAAWQRVQDLQREAENRRLTAGYPPRALVAALGLARLVGRLARSGAIRFQRRHAGAELEGPVDRWLKRSQEAASGESDGAQEVA